MRFTVDDITGTDAPRFNCGPGALCAAAGLLPAEALAALPGFDLKGYTNPRMMAAALASLEIGFRRVYERSGSVVGWGKPVFPEFGLVRVQWDGPWCRAGVPLMARYRKTHWVAWDSKHREVYDVNAMCVGGWISYAEWESQLVPWLQRECIPGSNGKWWPTHCWEVSHFDVPNKA